MGDAQLRIFIQLILTQLNAGIKTLETALPSQFRVQYGGTNILLDPVRTEFPVLAELYNLRDDLDEGLSTLDKSLSRE